MDKKVNINLNTEVVYHGDKTFEEIVAHNQELEHLDMEARNEDTTINNK